MIKKYRLFFMYTFLIGVFCSSVLAQSIVDVEINRDIFIKDDELEINALIENSLDKSLYLRYLFFTNNGASFSSSIKINPHTFGNINAYKTKINDDFVNGDYFVWIRLTDGFNEIYDSKELNFSVEGLLEEFDINLYICKDSSCTFNSKIFVLNNMIYLNFNSEVSSPIIQATLTYPDKTSKEINLPYQFKADQIGIYELEVTASKEGYKTKTIKEQFGVIEKEAEIKTVVICNANNICEEPRENKNNCPQDCVKKETKNNFNKYYLIPIAILLLIGYWLYKKKVK